MVNHEQRRERGRRRLSLTFLAISLAVAFLLGQASKVDGQVPAAGAANVLEAGLQLDIDLFTDTPDLQIAEYCQRDHATELAFVFQQLMGSMQFWSGCPSNTWLSKFQEISPGGRKVIIDIGCNKGFTSSTFFALWAPELKFNPVGIGKFAPRMECGACQDCKEEVAPTAGSELQTGLHVLCVEPSIVSFSHLLNTRQHFFKGANPGARWNLLHAAVSNTSGYVPFHRCALGDETCNLDRHTEVDLVGADPEVDMVPLMTLDELLAIYKFDFVDVLKIDTEGYDVPTIEGATRSLMAGKVGIMVFEYHGVGLWKHNNLQDVVTRLNGLNMVCYYSGQQSEQGSLARLTGCWNAAFEMHAWSNIICIRRDHEMYPHAERMSTRYAKYRDLYYKMPANL